MTHGVPSAAEVDMAEGSIAKHRRPNGEIAYRVRLRVGGKRISYGLFDAYEEAEDQLAAAIEQRGADAGAKTLRAWGVEWLERRERSGKRAIRKDRLRWAKHVAASWIAALPLRRLSRHDVVRFLRELGEKTTGKGKRLSRQTRVHVLNLLRKALADAADENAIAANVAHDVRVPREAASTEEPWTWLTAAEIAALLALPVSGETRRAFDGSETATIPPGTKALLTVAIYAGLRAGELWALTWGDVILDPRRPELIVRASNDGPTKSGRVRRVPLLAPALAALELWHAQRPGIGRGLVFPAVDGARHVEGYDADWLRVRRLAGIHRRVRFHDLRHTCASHLVQGTWGRTWSLPEVGMFLGHSSPVVTARYAHLAPGGLHDAARLTHAGHSRDTGATVVPIDAARKGSEP